MPIIHNSLSIQLFYCFLFLMVLHKILYPVNDVKHFLFAVLIILWFELLHLCRSVGVANEGKGKVVPLQAWSGPEGSRKLRFPDYMTTAQEGGKVVSVTQRPPLPPENAPGTHFC